jgi:bis(5'-nucleosidyl)-tetraphosphatase
MKSAKSCGGVIFRQKNKKIEFLVIRNKGGGHWDFPKGHVEEGETEEETAKREIMEEVGLEVQFIPGFKESIHYVDVINNFDKIVVFFLCEAKTSEVKYIFDEVSSHEWLQYDDAARKLTFDNARNILKKASSFLEKHH